MKIFLWMMTVRIFAFHQTVLKSFYESPSWSWTQRQKQSLSFLFSQEPLQTRQWCHQIRHCHLSDFIATRLWLFMCHKLSHNFMAVWASYMDSPKLSLAPRQNANLFSIVSFGGMFLYARPNALFLQFVPYNFCECGFQLIIK